MDYFSKKTRTNGFTFVNRDNGGSAVRMFEEFMASSLLYYLKSALTQGFTNLFTG
jgi:hypothetical protein